MLKQEQEDKNHSFYGFRLNPNLELIVRLAGWRPKGAFDISGRAPHLHLIVTFFLF